MIISTRNRAHYLPEVLRTLAEQDCTTPFEVIVIDNGSTDDTRRVLDAWCRGDARFRTAHEPRPGLSRGKNAGARLARGPLLLFTDDDVRADPRWIRTYLDLFVRHPNPMMIAGGAIIPIPNDLGPWPAWFDEAALPDVGMLPHREERRLAPREYLWGANMAIPAALFQRLGGWDETAGIAGEGKVTGNESRHFEDTEFQDRVRAAGGAVWFCPEAQVRHRVDRRTVTPRRIARTAFDRGRAEFWREELETWKEMAAVPKRGAWSGLLGLLASEIRWTASLLLFLPARTRTAFERLRRAAHTTGRRFDMLLAGRSGARVFQVIGDFALMIRGILIRLTPDVP